MRECATLYARICPERRDLLCVDNFPVPQGYPRLPICGAVGFRIRPASVASTFAPAYTTDTFRISARKAALKSRVRPYSAPNCIASAGHGIVVAFFA